MKTTFTLVFIVAPVLMTLAVVLIVGLNLELCCHLHDGASTFASMVRFGGVTDFPSFPFVVLRRGIFDESLRRLWFLFPSVYRSLSLNDCSGRRQSLARWSAAFIDHPLMN
jgi:hypothetical protein